MVRCAALSKWAQETTSLPSQLPDCVHWTSQMIEGKWCEGNSWYPEATLLGERWTNDWNEPSFCWVEKPQASAAQGGELDLLNIIMGWKMKVVFEHMEFLWWTVFIVAVDDRFFSTKERISRMVFEPFWPEKRFAFHSGLESDILLTVN